MNSATGAAEWYWTDSPEPTSYPPVTADLEADVTVIGAGLRAVSEIAATGRTVVVLAGDRISPSAAAAMKAWSAHHSNLSIRKPGDRPGNRPPHDAVREHPATILPGENTEGDDHRWTSHCPPPCTPASTTP